MTAFAGGCRNKTSGGAPRETHRHAHTAARERAHKHMTHVLGTVGCGVRVAAAITRLRFKRAMARGGRRGLTDWELGGK